jgi:TolB protein
LTIRRVLPSLLALAVLAAIVLFVWPGLLRAGAATGTLALQRGTDAGYRIYTLDVRDGIGHALPLGVQGSLASPRYAPDGSSLAFVGQSSERRQDLYVARPDGSGAKSIVAAPNSSIQGPAWSPDSTTIAFHWNKDGNWEIYTVHADGTDLRRITNHPAFDSTPVFAPDGRSIMFTSDRIGDAVGEDSHVYRMNIDGSGVRQITQGEDESTADFSPDGSRIAYVGFTRGNADIWVADADGTHPRRITRNPIFEYTPRWSPDGDWLAFEGYVASFPELFLVRPDGSGRRQLTHAGVYSGEPSWHPPAGRAR